MTEFWEDAFSEKQMMWGLEATASAIFARDHFAAMGGDDWYERMPNLQMYFYDAESATREFAGCGLMELREIDEAAHGVSLPFINAVCRKS